MLSAKWDLQKGHLPTKWVDQKDQFTDIFKEVSLFVVWLGRFAPFAK